MSALPKATSQGSNGAGGGAFAALSGMSAASAEPEIIASAVANKIIFFMDIPIAFTSPQPDSDAPRGNAIRLEFPISERNLDCAGFRVKQKCQAFADFLGV